MQHTAPATPQVWATPKACPGHTHYVCVASTTIVVLQPPHRRGLHLRHAQGTHTTFTLQAQPM
eukprot:636561-Pelagomonas_calceolata.AAC.1